mmetsp:Transcript_34740/g.99749  ORF Transcript_34740/g.99749 Transcript_34740/m.99749 type:complete len:306 (+) Transcript_34740:124-1041(+)
MGSPTKPHVGEPYSVPYRWWPAGLRRPEVDTSATQQSLMQIMTLQLHSVQLMIKILQDISPSPTPPRDQATPINLHDALFPEPHRGTDLHAPQAPHGNHREHQAPRDEPQAHRGNHQEPGRKHQALCDAPQALRGNHQDARAEHQAPRDEHQALHGNHQAPRDEHQAPRDLPQALRGNHQERCDEHLVLALCGNHQDHCDEHQAPCDEPQAHRGDHQDARAEHQAPRDEHQALAQEGHSGERPMDAVWRVLTEPENSEGATREFISQRCDIEGASAEQAINEWISLGMVKMRWSEDQPVFSWVGP